MATTISIGWKVTNATNGLQELTLRAEDLRKVMQMNVEESEKLQKNFVNFAAICTSIDSVSNTLDTLKGVVDDLCGAYDIQIEAETRLEQVMRNTMEATDEQIQSIKDFCSAQQEIGVVGDEVQLAGAQELATYVSLTGSLKSLIPVMNDMLVQQYGLSASGEAAASIAGMLGKVLDGQTGALSRYGYKFDEAQEKILKYGTETERVATLVEVVSDSVGGMNQAMAQTDSGRQQQLANKLGDVKEELGRIAKSAQGPLTIAANTTIAFGGVMKLVKGVKELNTVLTATKLISGGIGLALTALIGIIGYLKLKGDDATDSLDRLASAEQRAADAARMAEDMATSEAEARKSAAAALTDNIARLKEFNGTKADEKKLVKEMNDTYGTTMGYFASVSEWYKTLTANSKTYCDQMVNEAKARMLANQIAELDDKRRQITHDEYGNRRMYAKQDGEMVWRTVNKEEYEMAVKDKAPHKIEKKKGSGVDWAEEKIIYRVGAYTDSSFTKAQTAVNDLSAQINSKQKQLEETRTATFTMPVMGSPQAPESGSGGRGSGSAASKTETTRLQEISKELIKLNEEYLTASDTEKTAIKSKVDTLLKEKQAIELTQAELQRPAKLDSLSAYTKEIAYQSRLRDTASQDRVKEIDAEIKRLEKEKEAFEGVAEAAGKVVAARPEDAHTLEEIGAAISDIDDKIQRASADEIEALTRSRMAFERKKEAMERGIRIPEMQKEVSDLQELPDRVMKVKIQGMGFEALSEKIRDIQRQLDDLDNPPTEGQRTALESLKRTYEGWRKECALSFDTLTEGWSNVKSIGSGIENLASALTDSGNAWQMMTGIVDGFIQTYNGVMAIIEIMQMLGVISKANTAAKTAEAAATAAATTATGVEIGMAEGAAAAQIPVIVANKASATSFLELAAAEYMAAHASIPFAGFGIGSGFAAAAAGVVKGIGAVPFADGGIVYGPTLGLVGEYAGASSNPEVIAPLNKLRDIIGDNPSLGNVHFSGVFKIHGPDLVASVENQCRISRASGRKIKI